MDGAAQRKARLEALEEKKKRLEAMKLARHERAEKCDDASTSPGQSAAISVSADEIIASLFIDTKTVCNAAPVASCSPRDDSEEKLTRKNVRLVTCKSIASYHIPSKSMEFYDKCCQTDDIEQPQSEMGLSSASSDDYNSPMKISHRRVKTSLASDQLLRSPLDELSNHSKTTLNKHTIARSPNARSPSAQRSFFNQTSFESTPLNDPEEIVASEPFANFLKSTSRVVERALIQSESFDVIKQYSGMDESSASTARSSDTNLTIVSTLECASMRNRPVLNIANCSHFPELLLIVYGSTRVTQSSDSGASTTATTASSTLDDVPGLVCLWSSVVTTQPEVVFHSSSPVTFASFVSKDVPCLLLGGCANGQLLLWDMRAKELPVQRSSLSGKGHKHPIVLISCNAGHSHHSTASDHSSSSGQLDRSSSSSSTSSTATVEIFSVSMDGVCCQWDLANLSEPVQVFSIANFVPTPSLSLAAPGVPAVSQIGAVRVSLSGGQSTASSSMTVNITTMMLLTMDSMRFALFGDGSGHVSKTCFPPRQSESSIELLAHLGVVTAIDVHPSSVSVFSHLTLTASLDWTVKLWDLAALHALATSSSAAGSAGKVVQPLLEFKTASFASVSDVKWSPSNPVLFCVLTAAGDVCVWNIAQSVLRPVEVVNMSKLPRVTSSSSSSSTSAGAPAGKVALNKAMWAADGRSLYVGDSRGAVHVMCLTDQLCRTDPGDKLKVQKMLASVSTPLAGPASNTGSAAVLEDDDDNDDDDQEARVLSKDDSVEAMADAVIEDDKLGGNE